MTELKRCPFCGGEAEIYPEVDGMMGKFWYIRCKKCYSRGTGIYESGRKTGAARRICRNNGGMGESNRSMEQEGEGGDT